MTDTPNEAPNIDTVAGMLGDLMPNLTNESARKVATSILRTLWDAGWRPMNQTQAQSPPMEMLRRWALYSAFDGDTPEEIARHCGLNPVSDEVAAMERAAAMRRVTRVLPNRDFVQDHCDFFAGIYVGIQREQSQADPSGPDIPDAYWAHAEEQMSTMLRSTCMSLLATLYGLDIVQEGKGETLHGI